MSVECKKLACKKYKYPGECTSLSGCTYSEAHEPAPNESPSSPQTSGSPTAARSDSVEGTASQLAPVLRPRRLYRETGRRLCRYAGALRKL